MKILTYIQHTRLIKPTGIGNHIKNIIPRLSEKYDLDILTSEKYKKHKEVKRLIGSWDLNVKTYKTPRTIIDKFWKYLKFPKIDSLAENYDWIYNPAESYIPLNNKTKQAVTIHDARHFNKKFNKSLISRFLWKLYIERINKNVDIVFTVSEFSKKELIRLTSLSRDKIKVIGNGIGDYFFQEKETKNKVKPPYVLVVGGLTHLKGADYILKLANSLKGTDIKIAIVSGQRSDKKYLKQSKKLNNIIHNEYVTKEELYNYYKNSICLFFPSRYEGFGLPALEAMAVGTPVIASKSTSLPEIIKNTGINIDPENTGKIINQIRKFKNDKKLRKKYIKKGKKRAKKFSWNKVVNKIKKNLK